MTSKLDFSKMVLIGSIFYSKHSIVEDHDKGTFDRVKAEEMINRQEDLSDKYAEKAQMKKMLLKPIELQIEIMNSYGFSSFNPAEYMSLYRRECSNSLKEL